jgi:hypothetical protein
MVQYCSLWSPFGAVLHDLLSKWMEQSWSIWCPIEAVLLYVMSKWNRSLVFQCPNSCPDQFHVEVDRAVLLYLISKWMKQYCSFDVEVDGTVLLYLILQWKEQYCSVWCPHGTIRLYLMSKWISPAQFDVGGWSSIAVFDVQLEQSYSIYVQMKQSSCIWMSKWMEQSCSIWYPCGAVLPYMDVQMYRQELKNML